MGLGRSMVRQKRKATVEANRRRLLFGPMTLPQRAPTLTPRHPSRLTFCPLRCEGVGLLLLKIGHMTDCSGSSEGVLFQADYCHRCRPFYKRFQKQVRAPQDAS